MVLPPRSVGSIAAQYLRGAAVGGAAEVSLLHHHLAKLQGVPGFQDDSPQEDLLARLVKDVRHWQERVGEQRLIAKSDQEKRAGRADESRGRRAESDESCGRRADPVMSPGPACDESRVARVSPGAGARNP